MTGYAPNPKSVESAAASLTSGLLARKGQAAPAVDAVAHEGVDIDLKPVPVRRRRPRMVEDEPIDAPYVANPDDDDAAVEPAPDASPYEIARRADGGYRQRASVTLDAAPENWTVTSESVLRRNAKPIAGNPATGGAAAGTEPGGAGLRATVKFRMPAPDFVRLRLASRAMKESCQTIIIDAIAAYLDANEVEVVDGVTTRQEVERLIRKRSYR